MNKRIAKKHLKVVNAIIIAPFVVKIGFNDRSKQVIDFGEWMKNQPKGIYDELTEEHQFSSEMRIEDGNLVWGNNWLISFDVMNYYHGDLFGYYE